MKHNKAKQISQLIDHSNAMLKSAEQGDWDEVIEAETLRHDLIKALFSTPSMAKDVKEISDATREIMRINEMLKDHALHMMYRVNSGLESIHHDRTAVGAYAKNAR